MPRPGTPVTCQGCDGRRRGVPGRRRRRHVPAQSSKSAGYFRLETVPRTSGCASRLAGRACQLIASRCTRFSRGYRPPHGRRQHAGGGYCRARQAGGEGGHSRAGCPGRRGFRRRERSRPHGRLCAPRTAYGRMGTGRRDHPPGTADPGRPRITLATSSSSRRPARRPRPAPFAASRRRCQRSSVPGVTIRRARSPLGMILASAASTAGRPRTCAVWGSPGAVRPPRAAARVSPRPWLMRTGPAAPARTARSPAAGTPARHTWVPIMSVP